MQIIQVEQTTLPGTGVTARVALISDIHLGVYKDRAFLQRVVDRINALPALDAVVIAGDLTYEPQDRDLQALFAPLARLRAPTYAVLGNHDQQRPGPDIDIALRAALHAHGVQVIEGRIITETRGENGFGYDPLFVPDGSDKTFSELDSAVKNTLSHRGHALRNAADAWRAWLTPHA